MKITFDMLFFKIKSNLILVHEKLQHLNNLFPIKPNCNEPFLTKSFKPNDEIQSTFDVLKFSFISITTTFFRLIFALSVV